MLLCPAHAEVREILRFLGRFTVFLGILFLIPALVSLMCGENATAVRIAFGGVTTIWIGLLFQRGCRDGGNLSAQAAFVLAALVWVQATLVTGWTYWLTGCFASFIDACFDAMSGYTTTGLTLLVDLDHAPEGLQFLRHFVTFLGGQGIIVLFLVFVSESAPEYFSLYAAEGKDERLWPSVLHTARTIWWISIGFLAAGTAILYPCLRMAGMEPLRAMLDAVYLFEGAWSTGGFAPHSQNLLYYHSGTVETVTLVLFVLGSLNFAVHHAVFSGNPRELMRNTEVRSFAVTMLLLSILSTWFCVREGVYGSPEMAVRKVVYQLASAHTTTGNMTVHARQFIHDWPMPAFLCLVLAMVIGGSACSTAGGIKGMRLALLLKTIWYDVKRQLLPPHAIVTVRWHHLRPRLLDPELGYRTLLLVALFGMLYLGTTLAGVFAGYPVADALFEGVSAASNTGLSCGVTTTATPVWLKLVYILAMWLGRLEFTAVLVLGGYVLALASGRGRGGLRQKALVALLLIAICGTASQASAGKPEPEPRWVTASAALLTEESKVLDGGLFAVSGEVIGEPLRASGGIWLNILDEGNPISVFCPKPLAASAAVLVGGNRQRRGHLVRVFGILHRICPDHGGDLDLHAVRMELLGPPLAHPETLGGSELLALFCIGLSGIWHLGCRAFSRNGSRHSTQGNEEREECHERIP
ncbi:MAG TPA: TrkH family potassium uptake protein [Candidatus Ozemobacteraceae bacterium]|nr:TrkH family potassium uptake protein [Candidatus Ozemobacteraceae bacterium]